MNNLGTLFKRFVDLSGGNWDYWNLLADLRFNSDHASLGVTPAHPRIILATHVELRGDDEHEPDLLALMPLLLTVHKHGCRTSSRS